MSADHEQDQLYATPRPEVGDFLFDATVARVFPDMINRSVPGYGTVIGLSGILAARYAQAHSTLYDLGCSLGATTLAMRQRVTAAGCRIVAVDNSPAMLDRCRQHIAADSALLPVELLCADIQQLALSNASVIVVNFTLQFVPLAQRLPLLRRLHAALLPGGALILSEKIAFADADEQQRLEELHVLFKKANGYSDLEISQKRTALENVLLPETLEQHQLRLRQAGFTRVTPWFQCLNFASLLALK